MSEANVLVPTPPMGWNSWNCFGGQVSEMVVKETADAIVDRGFLAAGYTFVVIDDHWHGGRDAQGNLFPDPQRFPGGMAALAAYVHGKGLKFGIYSDAGTKTCGGQPGSLGYEVQDANTFASWGVDFLKYDYCYAPEDRASAQRLYATMGQALRATGRPIVFSVCEWGQRRPWLWAADVGGHMWRTTGDIWDGWSDGIKSWEYGIDSIGFEQQRGLEVYAGPGHWNDPDMLVVGLRGQGSVHGPGCTEVEYRTHFSLWCMLSAPLMIGSDIRNMQPVFQEMLTNPEVLALNQDPAGKQGYRVFRSGRGEGWLKPLENDQLGIGLFNRGVESQLIKAFWSDLQLSGRYLVRDLWQRKDLGVFEDSFQAEVASHGCVLLRFTPA